MNKKILIFIVFFIAVTVLMGGCGGAKKTTTPPTTMVTTAVAPTQTATPTPTPTPSPTPTPTETSMPSPIITETSAPTPTPSETPTPALLASAIITDGVDDVFNAGGTPAPSISYLDIIEVEISAYDTYYLARMKLNGELPAQTPDPSIFFEWDIFVDSDLNPGTGWNWLLICNDIGPDYMFRLELLDDQYNGTVAFLNSQGGVDRWENIPFTIEGDTIIWRLPRTSEQPTTFNFSAAVRKYGNRGTPDALQLADKAPDTGHATFQLQ